MVMLVSSFGFEPPILVEVQAFIFLSFIASFYPHLFLRGASPLHSFLVGDLCFRFLVSTQLWKIIIVRGLLIVSLLLELLQDLFLKNMAFLALKFCLIRFILSIFLKLNGSKWDNFHIMKLVYLYTQLENGHKNKQNEYNAYFNWY